MRVVLVWALLVVVLLFSLHSSEAKKKGKKQGGNSKHGKHSKSKDIHSGSGSKSGLDWTDGDAEGWNWAGGHGGNGHAGGWGGNHGNGQGGWGGNHGNGQGGWGGNHGDGDSGSKSNSGSGSKSNSGSDSDSGWGWGGWSWGKSSDKSSSQGEDDAGTADDDDEVTGWSGCLGNMGYDLTNNGFNLRHHHDYSSILDDLEAQHQSHSMSDPNAVQTMLTDAMDDGREDEHCSSQSNAVCGSWNGRRCRKVCHRWTRWRRMLKRFWSPCFGCEKDACSQSDGLGSLCKVEVVNAATGQVFLARDICSGSCGAGSECREVENLCDNNNQQQHKGVMGYFGCYLSRHLPSCLQLKVYKCHCGTAQTTTAPPPDTTTGGPPPPSTTGGASNTTTTTTAPPPSTTGGGAPNARARAPPRR